MKMKIVPAIDILKGKVVRLLKGNYQIPTEYSESPLNITKTFFQQGFDHLHLVDLGGAKDGTTYLTDLIPQIIALGVTTQVGGGIRTIEAAGTYFSAGTTNIIVSTSALLDPTFYKKLCERFGEERIILSLDIVDGALAIKGWKETLNLTLSDVIEQYNLKSVIVTDISRDGTLSGVDIKMYRELTKRHPHVNVIAAGGVSSLKTIQQLKDVGVARAIVGKAFYEDETFRNEVIKYAR